ncbi:MAG TPA: SulP family inorganic anion transporter [Casimicrobiaceae bacterium]
MPPILLRLFPFLAWKSRIDRATLRADLAAGLVSAVLVLPQGVAFATLAGMPPEYGLYGAMLPAIVGALWGSSWHLVSGPTNATSLMVFATVGAFAPPFTAAYVARVLTLNLMIGLIKLGLGLARLGALVNFISTTVVVGFTAGAGLLIIGAQLRNFFGLAIPQHPSFAPALTDFIEHVGETHPPTLLVGVVTLAAAVAGRRWLPRIPYMMTGIVAGSVAAAALRFAGVTGVATIGELPSAIPPLSSPEFTLGAWRELAPVALALTVIGITEAISSARAVALRSGQRIDANQEFIGQGLANIAGAFTSSYPTSGSFNRTGANFEAGARTPLAAIFSAGFLVLILLFIRPLAAYVPVAAMAGVLFIVAFQLVDLAAIRRLARVSRGEALTLAVTFIATLTIRLEVAILVGVLVSLLVYLQRTTHPRVTRVQPLQDAARHFRPVDEDAPSCPQLDILRIDGSLFFGAVDHVRDELEAAHRVRPAVRHELIVMSGVNFVDASGAALLAQHAAALRDAGVTLFLCNVKPGVLEVLENAGYLDPIGLDRIFDTKDAALRTIYRALDASACAACAARIFTECQHALPDGTLRDPPRPALELAPSQRR